MRDLTGTRVDVTSEVGLEEVTSFRPIRSLCVDPTSYAVRRILRDVDREPGNRLREKML